MRERERERERQTDRQTDRQREHVCFCESVRVYTLAIVYSDTFSLV